MRWLPIGSWEPHGGHLPYDTDTRIAIALCHACAQPQDTVLPAIPYSCSFEHRGLGQVVSIRVAHFAALLTDIVWAQSDPLVIINGHGGNQVLGSLVQEWNADGARVLLLPDRAHWAAAYQAAGWDFGPHEDMHAGALERSLLLYLAPETVTSEIPADVSQPNRPYFSASGMHGYTVSGVIGYPTAATAEAGQTAWNALTETIRDVVKGWK
ncbi:creatininase family protein [Sulfobacillus thermosulfidooxidans]|uniref:creatininase family protein n=1 Tax=Sulfobacillus thermosulfidooxidans TaxID=28034 RepID=UPI0006B5BC15|nr:creatininase family protein [Sulfobacillus thermosulfidooxidans]